LEKDENTSAQLALPFRQLIPYSLNFYV